MHDKGTEIPIIKYSLFKTKMCLSISEAGSPILLELSNLYLTAFLFGQSVFSNQLL